MSRHALVVGINQYKHLKPLNTPANDAEAIAQILETYGDFKIHRLPEIVQDDKVQVAREESVTLEKLENEIIRLFKPETKNIPYTTALLFFAGHGLRKMKGGIEEGYLATTDTNHMRIGGHWGLSIQWLRSLLQSSPVKQQIVWLDCCYSGQIFNFKETDPGDRSAGLDRCFITASREYEVAYDENIGNHGVLTSSLLQGLDPKHHYDGDVNNYKLVEFIAKKMKSATQEPMFANSGDIITLTHSKDKFIDREVKKDNQKLSSVCPYKGLEFFDFNDKDPHYFYGRNKLIDNLLEKVSTGNFLAVLGVSGSGKSSVIRAGLLHQLKLGQHLSGSDQWKIYLPFTPASENKSPLDNLARVFVESELSIINYATELKKVKDLIATGAEGLKLLIEATNAPRVVLVIDQFEEIFTRCQDDKERQEFFECLFGALEQTGNKLCLVIAMRADFRGKCAEQEYAGLNRQIDANQVTITPMNQKELEQAITEPAKQEGLAVERELVTQILKDVKGPGSLPLLQYTLWVLWQKGMVNLTTYTKLGGVNGAIEKRADIIYNKSLSSDKEHQDSLSSKEEQSMAQWIFLQLTQLGEGVEDTRKQVFKSDLITAKHSETLVDHTLQKLTDARLVVSNSLQARGDNNHTPVTVVDIAHESLIRHWPRLRDWINENRETLRRKREIENDATKWRDSGKKDVAYFLQGSKLNTAEDYLNKYADTVPLSNLAKEFVEESKKECNHLFEVEKKRQQQELERIRQSKKRQKAETEARIQAERSNKKVRFYILIVFLLFAAGSVLLGLIAWKEKNKAVRQESRLLAQLAQEEIKKGNATEGIKLALKSLDNLNQSDENEDMFKARSALYNAILNQRKYTIIDGHKKKITKANFSPNGKFVVTASEDGTARLWDVNNSQQPLAELEHGDIVNQAVFSPDSKWILTASDDKIVRLWSVDNPDQLLLQKVHDAPVYHAEFSPNGQQIITTSNNKTFLWNINLSEKKLDLLTVVSEHKKKVNYITFSPNGQYVVTVSNDYTAQLRNINKQNTFVLKHEDTIRHAAFSSDNKYIITASFDNTARVWDTEKGKEVAVLEHNVDVYQASFSPKDSKLVVTASTDNKARLWDISKPELPLHVLSHQDDVFSVTFSHNGEFLLTASADNKAFLWKANNPIIALTEFIGHKNWVYQAKFSSNDKKILTVSKDGTARLWDSNNLYKTQIVFKGDQDKIYRAAFSPDDKKVVTVSVDKTARLWDIKNHEQEPTVFIGHKDKIYDVVFSPDGKQIATASYDKTVLLWEVNKPKQQPTKFKHDAKVYRVAFNDNGQKLVTACFDKKAYLWSVNPKKIIHKFDVYSNNVIHVAFNPHNNNQVITTSEDGTAHLWDVNNPDTALAKFTHDKYINYATFSPTDDQLIITASKDNTACLWNIKQEQSIACLNKHTDSVHHAVFSPNGQYIVTSSADHEAHLWNIKNPKQPVLVEKLKGHTGDVMYAAFSPDGQGVVTVSQDNTIRLWNIEKPKQAFAEFKIHNASVNYVVFSKNGKQVLTTSFDATARLWPFFITTQDLKNYANEVKLDHYILEH